MLLHLWFSGKIITWKHLLIRNVPQGVRFTVPVPFYLLEYKNKLFLFDTGQQPPAPGIPADLNYIPEITEDQRAVNILKEKGISPGDITGIILSHNHADHSAGLADFPQTPCYVRKEELQYPGWAEKYDPGRWIFPEGIYDLCGDGRIVLLPTPGHTAGHQSLLLTMDNGEKLLLAADAAYTREALNDIPPASDNQSVCRKTIMTLRKYAANRVQIVTGHDPLQLQELQTQLI